MSGILFPNICTRAGHKQGGSGKGQNVEYHARFNAIKRRSRCFESYHKMQVCSSVLRYMSNRITRFYAHVIVGYLDEQTNEM